jgi:S1-C subfamily serine protease
MSSFESLYQTYKVCVVRITTRTSKGDLLTGTGFHIGDGYIVTARHVVEGLTIGEIVGDWADQKVSVAKIFYPSNHLIDLAVLETDFSLKHYMTKTTIIRGDKEMQKVDEIEIGGHFDDWLGDELTLSSVIVMGYPRVPLSKEPILVATVGEINAVVDKYNSPHPHFIISNMPRGGFSGATVISEYGFLIGVLIESLSEGQQNTELGFAAAISVEPLWDLLYESGIWPGKNAEFMRQFYEA